MELVELERAIHKYTALPNRRNWLVLRRHSRAKVREWLRQLTALSDDEIRTELWNTALSGFQIRIPDREDISRQLKHLTDTPSISPEQLNSYLSEHPEALTGNAEADICEKHSAWTQDVPRLRNTIAVLLDPSIDIVRRLDDVLGGAFHLRGFGQSTATTILVCYNDGDEELDGPRYCKWTGHTERALGMLGIQFPRSTPGDTYASVWEIEKRMVHDFEQLEDLSDVDLFMFYVDTRDPSGTYDAANT